MNGKFLRAALVAACLGLSYIVPAAPGSAQQNSFPMMPNLTLSDGSGVPFPLSNYAGMVIVLEFWSTSCGPCFKDLTFLNRLQGDFPGKPLMVIPVSEDTNGMPAVRAAINRQKLTFLKAFGDPNGGAAETLNLRGLPTSFVIDRHGRVVLQIEGPQQWDSPTYEKRINFLLQQP